jgi:hypothetical protein
MERPFIRRMTFRRRSAPHSGLFAPPLDIAREAGPSVVADRFEAVPSGASMLLRVHVDGAVDRADATLILGDGDALDVVRPLPGNMGALGFAVPAQAVDARFWLDVGGQVLQLGSPELRAA